MKTTQPTSRKPATRKSAPVRSSVSLLATNHPAEAAGIAVHQAVENGVSTVKGIALTAGGYVFGFVKGLIKGH